MENYRRGKIFRINTRDGQSVNFNQLNTSTGGQLLTNTEFMASNKASVVNDVFQIIRDASSQETARALQDSESATAIV